MPKRIGHKYFILWAPGPMLSWSAVNRKINSGQPSQKRVKTLIKPFCGLKFAMFPWFKPLDTYAFFSLCLSVLLMSLMPCYLFSFSFAAFLFLCFCLYTINPVDYNCVHLSTIGHCVYLFLSVCLHSSLSVCVFCLCLSTNWLLSLNQLVEEKENRLLACGLTLFILIFLGM